ncbi:membrane hypothetical protein [Candidatus Zixiibacteriota bacterium]|nr:membrane hypothetical protein [candidate division Zixibacteria bacterium]
MNKFNVDINHVLVKPIYMGLLMNIFVPVSLLAAAYFLDRSRATEPLNPAQDLNIFFWVLAVISILDGAAAIYFRQKRFFSPMIRSRETFEDDLVRGTFAASIICFAFTSAISVYGLVMYLLGGTFANFLFFVFLSFVAFQLVRPRHGFMEKVIAAQENLVERGQFLGAKI